MGFIVILIAVCIFALQRKYYPKYVYKNLEYRCFFSVKECCEEDMIYFTEVVENKKALPVIWLKSTVNSSVWLQFAENSSKVNGEMRSATSSFYLKGYQKITRSWKVKCLKRGVYSIPSVSLLCGDIVGSKTLAKAIPVNQTLKVLPTGVRDKEIQIKSNIFMGEMMAKRWIVPDPFIVTGVREYVFGDTQKDINWNATAKNNKLMVNKHDHSTEISITVFLNIQSLPVEWTETIDKASVEHGIKVVAAFAELALKNGIKFRFATNGITSDNKEEIIFTDCNAGNIHISDVLTKLALLKFKKNYHFDDYFEKIPIKEISNSTVLFVSCYQDQPMITNAKKLQKNGNQVYFIDISQEKKNGKTEGIDIYSF